MDRINRMDFGTGMRFNEPVHVREGVPLVRG
jgi:hypothetical protein